MDKRFLTVLAIIVIGLGGMFFFTKDKASAPQVNVSGGSSHSIGDDSAKVELLVYGDFECSACAQFYPIEKAILEKYSSTIKFTFKHFPLDSIHPNARAAARAAESAGMQGKFFEMHDELYINQTEWINSSNALTVFEKYAQKLGLNLDQFKSDFSSETVNSIINADAKLGQQAGVDGTPAYFINNERIDNSEIMSVDDFSNKIDSAIAKADSTQ